MEIKNVSQSKFLICNNHIKNNSYINLDGGSHIRIVWFCTNAVKTQNEIYSIKILATGIPVAKYLIKYYNSLEENEDVEKEPINIKLTERKKILIMMKMLLNLNDQVYKKMRNILCFG